MQPEVDWLQPHWSVPKVRAYCSTRAGRFNRPPYDGFNTANHVGDAPQDVAESRRWLGQYFNWQRQPQWLQQVHGTGVVEARGDGIERKADAVFSGIPGQVCTLHTADCLPVFLAAEDGSVVALAHAGWRGLAAGVLQNTVQAMAVQTSAVVAWLGPAISAQNFEVGEEVLATFTESIQGCEPCFSPNHRGRWQCDLYGLAKLVLKRSGVKTISGGDYCTFADPNLFSYRRSPVTGRLLSLIWIDPAQ